MSRASIFRGRSAGPLVFAILLACAAGAPLDAQESPSRGSLHFRGGFEGVSMTSGNGDIVGADTAFAAPNDWQADLEANPIGSFNIQYQGGDASQRLATLVPDPKNPGNQVLRFWMSEAHLGNRGRTQWNFYGNDAHQVKEFYYRYRFRIGEDMRLLLQSGRMEWMFIAEFWNEADWIGSAYPFRIHPQLYYRNGGIHIGVGADVGGSPGQWFDQWDYIDSSTPLPIGKWMTMEFYFREGNREQGRFQIAVTIDGVRHLVHDITDWTQHPKDPSPDGLTLFNPIKLYTSSYNVDTIRNAGGVLQLYYDDFEFWLNADMPRGGGNVSPVADLQASTSSGVAPLDIAFDASGSTDADGSIVSYAWDFGDGSSASGARVGHRYQSAGSYVASVVVTDDQGATSNASVTITVEPDLSGLSRLAIAAVAASAHETGNPPAGSIDGDLNTRWSAEGDPQTITWTLGEAARLELARIVFLKGDSRQTAFDLQVSADGSSWQTVASGPSSGTTAGFETISAPSSGAISAVRYVGHGNSDNLWNSLVEVELWGVPAPSAPNAAPTAAVAATPTSGSVPLTVAFDASASSDSDGSIAGYVWDFGDGSEGNGARVSHTYTAAGSYSATLTVLDDAGASASASVTITVEAAPSSSAVKLGIAAVAASSHELGNPPAGSIDGDLSTRWSAEGDPQLLTLSLSQPAILDHARIVWLQGDARVAWFELEASVDGSSWFQVAPGDSSGTTSGYETVPAASGQAVVAVRYVGHGNSSNQWNSVIELELWGTPVSTMPGAGPYQEQNGLVAIELADFDQQQASATHAWQAIDGLSGTAGGALEAAPNVGTNQLDGTGGPRLGYQVEFATSGTWYVWLRSWGTSGTNDSVHVGLDGQVATTGGYGMGTNVNAWAWNSEVVGSGRRVTLSVPSAGVHTVDVWMREDGTRIDQLVLTTDAAWSPSGQGPATSPRSADADQPPVVQAGGDASIVLGESLALGGSASDPEGGALVTAWSAEPATGVSFVDASDPATSVRFADSGTWVLTLSAADGRSTVSDSLTVTVAPAPSASFAAYVNFQPAGSAVPAGYVADSSGVFATRGALAYGWTSSFDETRDRRAHSDQRYDTLNHLQKNGVDRVWEIAVPSGIYRVRLVAGDPSYSNQINHLLLEGIRLADPDGTDRFDEYETLVEVTDGRLTLAPASDASNAKICFIEITSASTSN